MLCIIFCTYDLLWKIRIHVLFEQELFVLVLKPFWGLVL